MESSGIPYGDIIIIGAIAAFILLRYRAILGEKSGFDFSDDPAKPRRDEGSNATSDEDGDKVVALPGRAAPKKDRIAKKYSAFEDDIRAMQKDDPSFDPDGFVQGAQGAFEMLFKAFTEGDQETIRMLLADDIEEAFVEALDERESNGQVAKNSLIAITKTEIEAIDYRRPVAVIRVAVESEQVQALYDAEDVLIDGDASEVITVQDVWEFTRDMRSDDPNWLITDT